MLLRLAHAFDELPLRGWRRELLEGIAGKKRLNHRSVANVRIGTEQGLTLSEPPSGRIMRPAAEKFENRLAGPTILIRSLNRLRWLFFFRFFTHSRYMSVQLNSSGPPRHRSFQQVVRLLRRRQQGLSQHIRVVLL